MTKRSGLKITVNAAEDEQLRNWVKDLIHGQVVSIARDEVREAIKAAVVPESVAKFTEQTIKTQAEKIIKDAVTTKAFWPAEQAVNDAVIKAIKDYIAAEVGNQIGKMITMEMIEKALHDKADLAVTRVLKSLLVE